MKVYAFDFDGTLTRSDTLLEFISYAHGRFRLLLAMLLMSPLLVLMKLGLYSNEKAKQRLFSRFFKGMRISKFNELCVDFARSHRRLLRPKGMECLERAMQEGDYVMVISASIDNWVRPFFEECKGKAQLEILGTQIEVKDEMITGCFLTRNCYGQEKVNRISEVLRNRESYYLIAYGDSRGDKELLSYADEGYFKPFE